MITDALALTIIIFLGFSPILIMIWGVHYLARHPHWFLYRPHIRPQDVNPVSSRSSVQSLPQHTFASSRGRLSWLGPTGYLGDTSCRFNAHSPFIRCAVNPSGPCQGCASYETSAHLADSHSAQS